MLNKRIVPCLDVKNGRTVKGVNFVELIDAGDPVEQGAIYSAEGADELVFLDITATKEKRKTITELADRVAHQLDIPFTIGGGISSRGDVDALLSVGADKVSVNSSAVHRPDLVDELALQFGSQCIVVAIDAKLVDGTWIVHTAGGSKPSNRELFTWAKEVERRGAGEILFTSMNHDGTKQGFAIESLKKLSNMLQIPIIASGGAGRKEHFLEVFEQAEADAALAASVFHFNEISIPDLKEYLHEHNIKMRLDYDAQFKG